MVSPAIGPFSFLTMEGRFQTSSAPTIPTQRGLRTGRPRAKVATFRTSEEQPSFLSAWLQALYYRSGIGAITNVIDDTGVLAPYVLICDVHCTVKAATGGAGAILTTAWSLCPPLSYGWYGQVSQSQTTDLQSKGARTFDKPPGIVMTGNTIKINGVPFTTATGDLQWPISEGQIMGLERAAKALGIDNVVSRPAPSQGKLDVATDSATDASAFAVMTVMRSMVGTFVDIDLGGLVVPGVAFADANLTWKPTVVLPNGSTVLIEGTLEFSTQDTSGTGGPCAVVQCSPHWGTWQTVKLGYCMESSEGLGGSASHVAWTQDLGRVLQNGKANTNEPTDYTGQWCRILSRKNLLGDPDPSGNILAPVWWGEVLKDKISGGAGEGAAVRNVTCAGVMMAFTKCWPLRWYEIGQDSATTADPGEVLQFNEVRGGDSANPGDANAGELKGFNVHDRGRVLGNPPVVTPIPWTAHQLITTWIAAFQTQYPQGPRVTLTGQVTALDYVSAWDLRLKDFGNGLVEVISPRWGLSLRVEISTSDVVTLRVNTGNPTALVIPGLGTLPANDRQSVIDLTGNDVVSWDIDRDRTLEVDHVVIRAGRPWFAMSLGFGIDTLTGKSYQLVKGWTAAEEQAWTAGNLQTRNAIHLHHVWRRWRLAPDWFGCGFFAPFRNDFWKMNREVGTSAQLGANGYTGNLLTSGQPLRSSAIRFTRELPIWTGKDWTTIAGSFGPVDTASIPGSQLEGPILFGQHKDASQEYLSHKWMVQVENDNAGIILGHDAQDGQAIQSYLLASNSIVVTIGITHPLHWAMSWRRDQALRPRDMERCIVLEFPHLTYHSVIKGTQLWLDGPTGAHRMQADVRLDWETTTFSGISKLSPLLSLAAIRYGFPQIGASWTRRGIIDVSPATAPGSMITAARVPLDSNRQYTQAMAAVITGRHHHHMSGELATSYTCFPLLPSLDRVVMAPAVPMRMLGAHMQYMLGGT